MVLLGNKSPKGQGEIDATLDELDIKIIAFTPQMAAVATAAFLKYGKGQGHPAQLNFGDCMAYAAAKIDSVPLLFKEDDFRKTDVESAI